MTLNRVTHETILISILKNIFSDETVAPHLAFKDGTAAMLFYGLDRFSVDLDFDIISGDEDIVFSRVNEIVNTYGKVEAEKKRFNLFFLLSYMGKLKTDQNIKVEINRRSFGSRYQVKLYLGIPMKVMVEEDLIAHKLVAMYERLGKTNRDIYDVWFFLSHHWIVNKQILESRTGMKYKVFLKTCIDALEKMNDRTILSGLSELLTAKQKVWVKDHLQKEAIFWLKLAVRNEEQV